MIIVKDGVGALFGSQFPDQRLNNLLLQHQHYINHLQLPTTNFGQPYSYRNDLNELNNGIKQFSSSLICLSFNLIDCTDIRGNEIPFNDVKLQQLLESMIELEQFHLYATLNSYDNSRNVLSQF
ncbi:unnamed protein product [Adineta steineri]|uniref:Uncharacterized protein n=1 Tax=Adineta steineri TaxID=433720 RepID=A0A814UUV2_9BILA|nr:unnamed protein product [Adineta steineri]CAF1178785.1 unnamed protein product [Adineta steineri]